MAKSRKDSRGYVLANRWESEKRRSLFLFLYRLDKNRRTVYAKTLVELRAKERKIIRDKEDGLNPQLADRMTLNELYDRFIEQKYDLKPSTKVELISNMYNQLCQTKHLEKDWLVRSNILMWKNSYYRNYPGWRMKQIRWIVYIHSCIRHSRWL